MGGHNKIFVFPIAKPAQKTQLTFGTFDDMAPTFSADGKRIYYSSAEDDDILNLRSLDLATGAVKQYTDVLGGNMAPAPLGGKGPERLGFLSYYKGKYLFHSIELQDPMKEVEQEVQIASDDLQDFEPDVRHQVIPENKREKGRLEKLQFEGRPPLNVGVTSGGDFFGGSQAVISDVLEDQTFVITAQSLREFRSYDFTYLNVSRRLQWAVSAFDNTSFFYASPYDLTTGFSRQGAFATRRLTGASANAIYPLDKFRRIELGAGLYHQSEGFESSAAEELARQQAQALGVPFVFNTGSIAPLSVRFLGETTRFREFGPLSGNTYMVSAEHSPAVGSFLSRTTFQADLRTYRRLFGDMLFAARARGYKSTGNNPGIFYFGGDMELRGYPYLSFAGSEGFHANLELRFPVIHLMATPLGLFGPVRGTLFAGIGGAHFKGDRYRFSTKDSGVSYVNDPLFGEPVSGFHLIDGRASYGYGIAVNAFGLPMHFDWSKLTDLKVKSRKMQFDFWVGFDF